MREHQYFKPRSMSCIGDMDTCNIHPERIFYNCKKITKTAEVRFVQDWSFHSLQPFLSLFSSISPASRLNKAQNTRTQRKYKLSGRMLFLYFLPPLLSGYCFPLTDVGMALGSLPAPDNCYKAEERGEGTFMAVHSLRFYTSLGFRDRAWKHEIVLSTALRNIDWNRHDRDSRT